MQIKMQESHFPLYINPPCSYGKTLSILAQLLNTVYTGYAHTYYNNEKKKKYLI